MIRVIPCLDVKDGRVVKGVNFTNLQDAGDPVEQATLYDKAGADELAFLDIGASHEERPPILDVISQVAQQVFIPLTVGGGIDSAEGVRQLLMVGADRVSLNSAALKRPKVLTEIAKRFGSQCLVLAIDARRESDGNFYAYTHGGRHNTGKDAIAWGKEGVALGAGEILLTSMDRDGTRLGFDCELIAAMRKQVNVPIIASGGVGKVDDFIPGVKAGADAVLAASIFHYGEASISDAKHALEKAGAKIRPITNITNGTNTARTTHDTN